MEFPDLRAFAVKIVADTRYMSHEDATTLVTVALHEVYHQGYEASRQAVRVYSSGAILE